MNVKKDITTVEKIKASIPWIIFSLIFATILFWTYTGRFLFAALFFILF